MEKLRCLNCGSHGIEKLGNVYKCGHCGMTFEDDKMEQFSLAVRSIFGEELAAQKEEQIANCRQNLWRAAHAEFISAKELNERAWDMKRLLPDDFQANFYEAAASGVVRNLSDFLMSVDCLKQRMFLKDVCDFLIKSLKPETLNAVASFIDRVGSADAPLHEEISTAFSAEAEKLERDLYDVTHPRDVFVAYRSSDMPKVVELVNYLEEQEGLECFVSYRNLQHGLGAKDKYDEYLRLAIDNCRVLVFVSSVNSRAAGDARKKELPYIREEDFKRAPAEFSARADYINLPRKYKKPRVEYLTEGYRNTASERYIKEFFDGFTYRESLQAVAEAVFDILDAPVPADSDKERERLQKQQDELERQRQELEAERKRLEEERRKREEAERKAEEERKRLEEIKSKPWLAPDYPTIDNYDKSEFEIEGTNLKKYIGNGTNAKIPLGVTTIGEDAFDNCENLTSIEIPDGVTSIGGDAFYNCKSLTSVTIPNSVTSIGDNAFCHCESLTSIIIPLGVTSIGACAFRACTSLTSIEIPDSVTSIGRWAFEGCTSLTSIVIPNSVTSIGIGAFDKCESLTSITVDRNNKNYSSQDGILYNKQKTALLAVPGAKTAVIIPNSVTSICELAFYGCESLTSIIIPNSVTSIGWNAFEGCKNLTSIVIPNSVTSIGGNAFYNCTSLTSITVDRNNKNYSSRDGILYNREKTEILAVPGAKTAVTIPNSVTSIGDNAFRACTSLTSVTIPDSVTSIGWHAFDGCESLTIYCKAKKQPEGWDKNWNPDNRPVVWGYKGK